jgi:hypothetical protein
MSIDSARLLKGRLEEPESVHSRECADSRASPCARLGFLIACWGARTRGDLFSRRTELCAIVTEERPIEIRAYPFIILPAQHARG